MQPLTGTQGGPGSLAVPAPTAGSPMGPSTFVEIARKNLDGKKERIIAMQCVPRAEVSEDLVGAVLFLASEAASFVTGINLDGGVTGS